jgi:hypothetical protein
MTQVQIDLKNAKDAQSAVNAVLTVQMKLEKIVAALQHTNAIPDYKYLINYMVGDVGSSFIVSLSNIQLECDALTARLIALGVSELQVEGAYAEIASATLDYMIAEKMRGDTLTIKGSEIRYKDGWPGNGSKWENLPDSVKIIVTRFELTDEDREEFRRRQFIEALNAVAALGHTIDSEGLLIIA